jgi:hypothetical protein
MLTIIVLSASLLTSPMAGKDVHLFTTWEACEAARATAVAHQGLQLAKGSKKPLQVFSCVERGIQ